jgi:hypothetical protein
MFGAIIGLLGGPVARELAAAFRDKASAANDADRIAADERIAALRNARDVQVAEAGSRLNGLMRFLLAVGPAVYLFKIFAVDKVICQVFGWTGGACRTDDITDKQWTVVTAVIGFYFLYDLGSKFVARRK